MKNSHPLTVKEQNFILQAPLLCGVDEAGAGTLAGDLVVASCILDPNKPIIGLSDSKKLSEKKREELYQLIIDNALAYRVISISPSEIDASNILLCRMDGMRKSVSEFNALTTHAIVDGDRVPANMPLSTIAVVKGDDKVDCVRAASILAKVTHDRKLIEQSKMYPNFTFAKHKGYGTKAHKEELAAFGPTPLHRYSFKPVRIAHEELLERQN